MNLPRSSSGLGTSMSVAGAWTVMGAMMAVVMVEGGMVFACLSEVEVEVEVEILVVALRAVVRWLVSG